MRFNRIVMLIPALISIGCICVLAATLICAKCGYENESESKFCSHCGIALGGGAEANQDALNPSAGGQNAAITSVLVGAVLVEGDMNAASEQLDKHNGWLALFFCENAMALNTIAKTGKDLNDRLLLLQSKCEAGVKSSAKECRVCAGAGSIVKQGSSMSVEGRLRNQTPIKETCTSCRGTGIVPGRAGLDALKHGYEGALKQYAVLREGARWVPMGSAWIPLSLDCKLNYRQVAIIKRVTGSRCQNCAGAGQSTCTKCDGSGRKACTNRKCSGGFVSKKIEEGLTLQNRTLTVRCSTCDGRGWVKCEPCDGYGSSSCKVCRGRGKLPICQRCDGDGLKKCSTCNGTGMEKKAVCKTCGGCGNILCRSCMGCGRVRESD